MEYITVALALTCVGLALKLMTMKSSLTKAKMLLENERNSLKQTTEELLDLRKRSNERIKELKGRNNELLEETLENTKPGDLGDHLNELLSND